MNKMIPFIHKEPDFKLVQKLLQRSIKANHWTNEGPVKIMLEKYLHDYLKIDNDKVVICTSSGTAALHAIMLYRERSRTDWVIPSFTFPSANVNRFGVDIIDISAETYTLPYMPESHNGNVIITNLFGTISGVENWEKYSINEQIYDNAASPMSIYKDKTLCNWGGASFGSLHHTKYLGFGEGGFVVVPKFLDEAFRSICNFGYGKEKKHSNLSSNFKMSDVSAAYILAHIMRFDIQHYMDIQNMYLQLLCDIEGVEPFNYSEGVVYNTMPVLFKNPITVDPFREKGIEVNKYYRPLKDLPNSMYLYERIINFPLHTGLSYKDLIYITDTIRNEANR